MGAKSVLDAGLSVILAETMQPILFKRFSQTFNTGSYDDEVSYTIIGSEYISGALFPIRNKQGSEEAMLLEQGKLLTKDKTLYIPGSHTFSGALLFGIGSPTPSEHYTLIPDGIHNYSVNGSTVYSKIYIRHSIGGSLF